MSYAQWVEVVNSPGVLALIFAVGFCGVLGVYYFAHRVRR